jgi:hypothetical protein
MTNHDDMTIMTRFRKVLHVCACRGFIGTMIIIVMGGSWGTAGGVRFRLRPRRRRTTTEAARLRRDAQGNGYLNRSDDRIDGIRRSDKDLRRENVPVF